MCVTDFYITLVLIINLTLISQNFMNLNFLEIFI